MIARSTLQAEAQTIWNHAQDEGRPVPAVFHERHPGPALGWSDHDVQRLAVEVRIVVWAHMPV